MAHERAAHASSNKPLLRAEALVKRYPATRGSGARQEVTALNSISFSIYPGKTLAVVGESGSGKSTLALCASCAEKPTSGKLWLEETEVTSLTDAELRAFRPRVQLIFQNPASAMNPRWSAEDIVAEPLLIADTARKARIGRAHELLERVGLSAADGPRSLSEFSGGQRQRLAIARALTLEPKLLILDEALSALDNSIAAQIVNLLLDLQEANGTAYLFITHDLTLAAHFADEIAVIERGVIIEQGPTAQIVRTPRDERTRALLNAMPALDSTRAAQRRS